MYYQRIRTQIEESQLWIQIQRVAWFVMVCKLLLPATVSASEDTPLNLNSSYGKTSLSPMQDLSAISRLNLEPFLKNPRKILPLESLFPEILASNTNGTNKIPSAALNITSAILNHSMHHVGPNDDFDRMIFSRIPQGSKLVLQTIKFVKTGDNGDEEPMGDPRISLDVLPIGKKKSNQDSDEEMNEDDDENESEEVPEPSKDLASDASSNAKSPTYRAHAGSSISNDKYKEKDENYHRGQDFRQAHKHTETDTKGKKVTQYKGNEKGLTDFDETHGNSERNDGERFKNSKKKNKGRKVTGFKRVYHKEEFQRTEHFYDDEEAKKIAESYGLSNSQDKKEVGQKDDFRKYHGNRVEHSEGEKGKNEHITHHGHNKGYNVAHNHNEKGRHGQYQGGNFQTAPTHETHPNHKYSSAGYSNVNYNPAPAASTARQPTMGIGELRKPTRPLQYAIPFHEDVGLTPPLPLPDELKTFYAQRHRPLPTAPNNNYYAPNFQPTVGQESQNVIYSNGMIQLKPLGNDTGSGFNFATESSSTPKSNIITYDQPPPFYSTILKVHPRTYEFYRNPQNPNIISIDKAPGTQILSTTYIEPVASSPPKAVPVPLNPGIIINSANTQWIPMPSALPLTNKGLNLGWVTQNIQNLTANKLVSVFANNHTQPSMWDKRNFTTINQLESPPLPPLSPIIPKFQHSVSGIRYGSNAGEDSKSTTSSVLKSPFNPLVYQPPTTHIRHGFQFPEDIEAYSSGPGLYYHRKPIMSNFMNNFVGSVSDFFTRIGK